MSDTHQTQKTMPACVLTAQEIALMRRRFDRTCEELGVFPEDDAARRSLGRALVAAVARGDVELGRDDEARPAAVETLRFEGEELVVTITDRLAH
jgi:chaperonin cofactor prefoldin